MRNDRRGQEGYVTVYVALVASLVLVPMVLLVIDLAALAYHRTKLRNTADAVAIGAVAETQSLHIPIPTEWYGYVPVNGWMLNGLHLKNVGPSFALWRWGTKSKVKPKLEKVAALNQDEAGLSTTVTVGDATVLPMGNLFSPYMYVEIPVSADVPLQTPFLARILSQSGKAPPEGNTLKLEAKSCAVAWYRVDSWAHPWWTKDEEALDSLIHTLDQFLPIKEDTEPHKYYRLVNCATSADGVLSLAESVITEHLELQTGKEYKSPWERVDEQNAQKGKPPERTYTKKGEGADAKDGKDIWGTVLTSKGKEFGKVKESMKEPQDCRVAKTCLEPGATRDWAQAKEEQKRLEEEAEKAVSEAVKSLNE